MNALTGAIRAAYQQQTELLAAQNADLVALADNMQGKIEQDLMYVLRNAIYKSYRPELERIEIIITALQSVQASESGGECKEERKPGQ